MHKWKWKNAQMENGKAICVYLCFYFFIISVLVLLKKYPLHLIISIDLTCTTDLFQQKVVIHLCNEKKLYLRNMCTTSVHNSTLDTADLDENNLLDLIFWAKVCLRIADLLLKSVQRLIIYLCFMFLIFIDLWV